ncbi:MAG: hypothetical protein ACE5D1_07355, partial [Fidelibacterota bacterium]
MNTIATTLNSYRVEQALNQRPSGVAIPAKTSAEDGVEFVEQSAITETKTNAPKNVLNEKEMATLSMLFGSAKPEELKLYGNAQIQSIHKGHLLDIKG